MRALIIAIALSMFFASPALACRSRVQYNHFRATHPCPATNQIKGPCPGFVVDHIRALCKHGLDRADNMQWQSVAEAKAKDRIECK